MNERTAQRFVRVLGWGAVLLGVLALPWYFGRQDDDRDVFPSGELHALYLRVGEEKWLVSDRDHDGRVDCLLRPGIHAIGGGFRANGSKSKCGVLLGAQRSMPEDVRTQLTLLLSKKTAFRAAYTSPVDLDGDGRVDCVFSAFDPELTLLHGAGAPCASPGSRPLTDGERALFSDVLPIEQEAQRLVAALAAPR